MGIFEKIRRRSGLVILVIGTALAAFILGEFLNSGSSVFDSDQDAVGFINGNKVSYIEFNKDIEDLRLNNQQVSSFSAIQLSEVVWNQTLTKSIIGNIQDELGFTISTQELWDQIVSNPSIQQMEGFRDPNTGLFNPELLKSTLANLRDNRESSPEATDQWLNWVNFEENIRNEALTSKFYTAVKNGLNIPISIHNKDVSRMTTQSEIEWFGSMVSDVADSLVDVSESDYGSVFEENREDFKVKSELRDMIFADFPIIASDDDRALAFNELQDLKNEFVISNDDSSFVMANSDLPFQDVYFDLNLLDENLSSSVEGQEEGFVSDPIETGSGYQMLKIMDLRNLPDSVKAKHILISFEGAERSQVTRSFEEAKIIADSLFSILKSGESTFESVNDFLNDDIFSGSQGGDLGWFQPKQMAKSFDDFCFRQNEGDLGLVFTNFGYHIIDITNQKGSVPSVQMAQVFRRVNVSKETEQGIYKLAAEFAKALQSGENAEMIAQNFDVMLLPNRNTSSTDQSIAGLGESREVVRWLFNDERSINEVGIINNGYKNYVVTKLVDIYEPGYKTVADVKDELKALAINHAKVNYLRSVFDDQSILEWKKNTVSMANSFLPEAGREVEIVGLAVGSPIGFVSEAINGVNGVYKVKVLNVIENSSLNISAADVAAQVNQIRSRVQTELFEALVDVSEVVDNRGKFY
ncbi:MAG: Chaperone SurA [Owenweeksia sp. TMED14]|nr:MAG: Chaperone SurA [Owenweeksia sp. TMED14]